MTIREDEIKIADAVSRRSALSKLGGIALAGFGVVLAGCLDLAVVAVVAKLGERQI